MDKIEKIKAEIERRINILTNVYAEQVERKDEEMMNYYHGKVIALEELRPFLDTLSEEPDKGLEEAADEMAIMAFPEKKSYSTVYDRVVDYNAVDRKNYRDGIIAGAEWQKSQMLKDAVEGEAEELYNDGESQCVISVGTYFEPGDKVYVLKAEEG